MNRQIAKLGAVLLVCYLALFVQINRLTVFGAERLKDNPINTREILRDYDGPRGSIVTADGVVVARSEAAPEGSRFDRQRTYPEGNLFAHTVGYYSLNFGSSGVEDEYNAELVGRTLDLSFRDFNDLFGWHFDFFDQGGEALAFGLLANRGGDLLLEVGIGVDDVPLGFRHGPSALLQVWIHGVHPQAPRTKLTKIVMSVSARKRKIAIRIDMMTTKMVAWMVS